MPVISEQLKPIDTVNGFQIRPGFFREFGAIQTPFFTITKGKLSLLNRACLKIGRIINR